MIALFGGADPTGACAGIDVLVLTETRAEAVKLMRRIGLHSVRLRSPGEVPDDYVNALLGSGREILWRSDADPPDTWRTIDTWPGEKP
ncbi:MAG TPA: hypothetical protein VHG70_05290 [Nocardioidaceae bacterium]|nr:hypothetical protein [Nocardioidaceae bacterium]